MRPKSQGWGRRMGHDDASPWQRVQSLILDPGDGWAQLYTLGPEGAYDAGRPLDLDAPLEVAGLRLGATLRDIVELEG